MRARRTTLAVTGGATAVLAVVVAASAGLGGPVAEMPAAAPPPAVVRPSAGPVPADNAGPLEGSRLTPPTMFSTVLGQYRVGPYQIGPAGMVTAGFQELPVFRDGQTWNDDAGKAYPLSDGLIRIYRPGVFNPDTLGADEPTDYTFGASFPVTVAGRPGIGRLVSKAGGVASSAPADPGASSAPADPPDQFVRTALAWEYEPGAWATYVPQYMIRNESTQEALRVAGAVKPKAERPIRAPYRLTYLPAGWQTVGVTETPAKLSNLVSEAFLHYGSIPAAGRRDKVDLRLPSVHIVVMKGDPKNGDIRGKNGVHCYSPQAACTVVAGDYFIDVDGRASGLSEAEIRKIVAGLRAVNFTNPSTWVAVTR